MKPKSAAGRSPNHRPHGIAEQCALTTEATAAVEMDAIPLTETVNDHDQAQKQEKRSRAGSKPAQAAEPGRQATPSAPNLRMRQCHV